MSRGAKQLVIAVVAVALGVGGTAFAYAGGNWTVPGEAMMTATVARMPRGVPPSVAGQNGRAVVSWSAQEIAAGVLMDHYVVTAHSVDEPPLSDVTRMVAASGGTTETVIFGATERLGGWWYWTVTPRYRGWTGTESGRSQRLRFTGTPPAVTVGDDPANTGAPATAPEKPAPEKPAPEEPAATAPETAPAVEEPAETTPPTTEPVVEPTPEETETTDS
ncbi:hypothetical protein [Paractinoplanes toevensis]|uniref:Uncharacterized protein n=1 Tax=Paractinoplanes toevensis TaxID=571911 RepID=A0A919W7Z8_9ACTN|nr:hypothetical protein [Actinoplanes toevensis]GIM91236.1 hypothetical protein Ato02nite_030290 [Actinoplanes toevensis]